MKPPHHHRLNTIKAELAALAASENHHTETIRKAKAARAKVRHTMTMLMLEKHQLTRRGKK